MHTHIHACKHTFIHSGYFYSASSSPLGLLLRGAPDTARIVSKFHAEALQATENEGLAQGLYVAARAGFEPATLRTKSVESANEPPRSACMRVCIYTRAGKNLRFLKKVFRFLGFLGF